MAQIKELENMFKHILRVGLENLKLPRMASIISCWLFSPRIYVRPEKFQFMEKGQNRNFGYEIVISVKNTKFIF